MLCVGEKAPEFELPATKGETFSLAQETAGKNLLLAFYPFDWSPVCTNELGFLNTSVKDLRKKSVQVAAISVDSPFSHAAWAKAQKLAFPLLSDFNKDVCRAYGVLYDQYGGLKGFAKRSVFLIDPEQVVRYTWVSEDPANEPDYDELFAAVDRL